MEKNNIPRWNLDSIFPSIKTDEYKKALTDFSASMDDFEKLLTQDGNSDFNKWLSALIETRNKIHEFSQTLGAYAYIIYSVDTTNTEYLNNLSKIEEIGLRVNQLELKFKSALVAHKDKLPDFYKALPEYEEYRFLLQEAIDETSHQMSAAEENLAGELQRTGGDAWGRLQEQIISTSKDAETGKTFNELRNDAWSKNADQRKDSHFREVAILKQNEVALSACLNNIKGATVALNKRRNWNEAIDRALASSRMSRATLDALIGAIEESLPMWRKYFIAKAKYLRAHNLTASEISGTSGKDEGLAFYDLFAPVVASPEKKNPDSLLGRKWSFDEARDYIVERYNSFSTAMGDFAKNAFDSGWIDAEIREGKVGGAYDEDFPKGHQSRILSNFSGEFGDLITLAHELGHAYHFSCLKGKPAVFFSYPMTLAETASTFAETIVKQDIISKCSDEDLLQILDIDLQDAGQVLVDILSRFYFERSVFEKRQTSELSAADFCELMRDAQEKSYGCGLSSERHEYMWALKSHYYSTDLDFYNYPYAFGQLFGAGLYSRYQNEGPEFAKTYAELLSHTGSMSCEDLCKNAGFDITKREFWKSGIEMYAKEIEKFVELTSK